MKYLIACLGFFLATTSYGYLFQKEKTTFALAACKAKPQMKYTCCVYDQIEDGIKINEWVSKKILDKKKRTSSRGRANACDSLGIGIYQNVTYSYGGSSKCDAKSPIYKSKGEVIAKATLPALCKLETNSDEVEYH